MKILFFLSLLLFLYPFQQIFSQIKTGGTIKIGYEDRIMFLDDGHGNSYSSSWLTKNEFADIRLDAAYKKFYIYTNVKTSFRPIKIYEYNPRQVEYKLGLSYQLENFSFNYEHLCSHTILDKAIPTHEYFYEAYDRFFLEINLWGNKNKK
jgi:hypothetical protein